MKIFEIIYDKIRSIQDRIYLIALIVLLFLLSIYLWYYSELLVRSIMDISYHISTATSFARAGGIVGWDFWESLPLGRPHIYPPLFHLVFANFIKLGLSPYLCAKLMQELAIVGGLAIFAAGVSKLFNIKVAFWSVFFLSISWQFMSSAIALMPSTLMFFLTPALLYFLKQQRFFAYFATLVFILYLHLYLPYLVLLGVLLYVSIFERKIFWPTVKASILAFIIYLPWLVHVLHDGFEYIKYFDKTYPLAQLRSYFSINIIPYALALAVIIKYIKKSKEIALLACLSFSILLLAFIASNRTFVNHLLIPVAVLAGYGVIAFWKNGFSKFMIVLALMFYVFYIINLSFHDHKLYFVDYKRIPYVLIKTKSFQPDPNFKKYASLFELIQKNSQAGESVGAATIYFDPSMTTFNKTYQFAIGDFLAGSASRPILNQRMPEIYHREVPDLSKAKILFLNSQLQNLNSEYFKRFNYDPESSTTKSMTENIINNFSLIGTYPALDHNVFYVYKNNTNDVIREKIPKFVFSLWVADAIIILLIGLIIADTKGLLTFKNYNKFFPKNKSKGRT